jgi:two-component sensor histidine kinase
MIGTGQDISELKEYQEELDQSLKEKEVLLAEIHHRVKNNLAIISGLLQLEAFSVENEHTQKILKNSQMRIQSMATIHEMLYEAENFHDLSFEGFVEQIISSVREVYHQENQKISFSIDIKSINLNINQAVPCGLIINELITNAYKHAFDDKQEGYISIVGEKSDSNIQFTVKDNGEGLPADFSIEKQSSLGFTLISSLISQLGAELTVKSGEGTTFVFSFQQEAVRGSASTLEYA